MKMQIKNIAVIVVLVYSKIRKLLGKDTILVAGFVQHNGLLGIRPSNWGDDINTFWNWHQKGKWLCLMTIQ